MATKVVAGSHWVTSMCASPRRVRGRPLSAVRVVAPPDQMRSVEAAGPAVSPAIAVLAAIFSAVAAAAGESVERQVFGIGILPMGLR